MILGSFWKSTNKERGALFPNTAGKVKTSIRKLIVEVFDSLGGIICYKSHTQCNPAERLQRLVLDTYQKRQSVVTPDDLQRMRERREELGLADTELKKTTIKKARQI